MGYYNDGVHHDTILQWFIVGYTLLGQLTCAPTAPLTETVVSSNNLGASRGLSSLSSSKTSSPGTTENDDQVKESLITFKRTDDSLPLHIFKDVKYIERRGLRKNTRRTQPRQTSVKPRNTPRKLNPVNSGGVERPYTTYNYKKLSDFGHSSKTNAKTPVSGNSSGVPKKNEVKGPSDKKGEGWGTKTWNPLGNFSSSKEIKRQESSNARGSHKLETNNNSKVSSDRSTEKTLRNSGPKSGQRGTVSDTTKENKGEKKGNSPTNLFRGSSKKPEINNIDTLLNPGNNKGLATNSGHKSNYSHKNHVLERDQPSHISDIKDQSNRRKLSWPTNFHKGSPIKNDKDVNKSTNPKTTKDSNLPSGRKSEIAHNNYVSDIDQSSHVSDATDENNGKKENLFTHFSDKSPKSYEQDSIKKSPTSNPREYSGTSNHNIQEPNRILTTKQNQRGSSSDDTDEFNENTQNWFKRSESESSKNPELVSPDPAQHNEVANKNKDDWSSKLNKHGDNILGFLNKASDITSLPVVDSLGKLIFNKGGNGDQGSSVRDSQPGYKEHEDQGSSDQDGQNGHKDHEDQESSEQDGQRGYKNYEDQKSSELDGQHGYKNYEEQKSSGQESQPDYKGHEIQGSSQQDEYSGSKEDEYSSPWESHSIPEDSSKVNHSPERQSYGPDYPQKNYYNSKNGQTDLGYPLQQHDLPDDKKHDHSNSQKQNYPNNQYNDPSHAQYQNHYPDNQQYVPSHHNNYQPDNNQYNDPSHTQYQNHYPDNHQYDPSHHQNQNYQSDIQKYNPINPHYQNHYPDNHQYDPSRHQNQIYQPDNQEYIPSHSQYQNYYPDNYDHSCHFNNPPPYNPDSNYHHPYPPYQHNNQYGSGGYPPNPSNHHPQYDYSLSNPHGGTYLPPPPPSYNDNQH